MGARVEASPARLAANERINVDALASDRKALSRVWEMDFDPGSNVVDVYVRYLRGKLGAHHIATVRGAGYRWE